MDADHQPHCIPLAHDYINNCAICYDTTEHADPDPNCVTCSYRDSHRDRHPHSFPLRYAPRADLQPISVANPLYHTNSYGVLPNPYALKDSDPSTDSDQHPE